MDIVNLFWLLFISALPFIELRGSVPVGIAMGIHPFTVFFICTAANILIVPLLFLFMDHVFPYFEHLPAVHRLLERTHRKTHYYVQRYGTIGLAVFVAVPLPSTGAYTGVLASYIFEMDKKSAFLAIASGVVAAGILVTLFSIGLFAAFGRLFGF